MNDPEVFGTAAVAGLGGAMAAGVSLYDVYAATENHEEVLSALKYRYNVKLADVDNPLEWANYLSGKQANGEDAVLGVIRGMTGQLGEDSAVDYFNQLPALSENAITAELIENRSNESNDIQFFHSDGSPAEVDFGELGTLPSVSAKSFKDVSDFLNNIKDSHAELHIVNDELYSGLISSGQMANLNREGIQVINGGWQHTEITEMAKGTFEEYSDAIGLSDSVPGVAILFFGYKTFKNAQKRMQNKITWGEFGIDTAVDGTQAITAGIGGLIGVKAGTVIGTLFLPGVGTIIGGAVGLAVGVFGSASGFNWIKNKVKFGKITSSLKRIGNLYWENLIKKRVLSDRVGTILANAHLDLDDTQYQLAHELMLSNKYPSEVKGLYSKKEFYKPTPMGVLTRQHTNMLRAHSSACLEAGRKAVDKLWAICLHHGNNKTKRAKLYFASVLIDLHHHMFSADAYDDDVNQYQIELAKHPNHPYQIFNSVAPIEASDLLRDLTIQQYQIPDVKSTSIRINLWQPFFVVTGAIFLFLMSIVLGYLWLTQRYNLMIDFFKHPLSF